MDQKQLQRRKAALQRREDELTRWRSFLNSANRTPDEQRYIERKIEIAEREIATLKGRVGYA